MDSSGRLSVPLALAHRMPLSLLDSATDLSNIIDALIAESEAAGFRTLCYAYAPPLGSSNEREYFHASLDLPVGALPTTAECFEECAPIFGFMIEHAKPVAIARVTQDPELSRYIGESLFLSALFDHLGAGVLLPVFGPGGRKGCIGLGTGGDEGVAEPLTQTAWSIASWAHLCFCHMRQRENPPPRLTERESEVIDLVAQGLSNTDIAGVLSISPHTVNTHLKRVFLKLDSQDRVTASLRALAYSLVY